MLNLVGSTVTLTYLAVFDYDTSPKVFQTMLAFLGVRIAFCFMSSLAIYVGFNRELEKILNRQGTSQRQSPAIQAMVSGIDDEDV